MNLVLEALTVIYHVQKVDGEETAKMSVNARITPHVTHSSELVNVEEVGVVNSVTNHAPKIPME